MTRIVATTFFLTAGAAAFSLDIKPYSAQALSAGQRAGKPVSLHFHADWCPTCRAQEKVFQQLEGDASVTGTVLVVNYDKEKELRKQLGVRTQSTLIVYQGNVEKVRLAVDPVPDTVRAALLSAN